MFRPQYFIHYIIMEIKKNGNSTTTTTKINDSPLFRFVLDLSTHIIPGFVKKYKITLVYLPPNVHLRINLSGGLFMVFFRQKDSHR